MAKTNYFGTFLDTLNMPAPGQSSQAQPRPTLSLDALLKVWPDPDAVMTVGEVASAFKVSLDTAADVLLKAREFDLVTNQAGKFTLTGEGMKALTKVKPF